MKTVLLIDDDPLVRGALSQWFTVNGWEIHQAEDGDAGLKLASDHTPEVVICDLLMPGCNGFQVCRALRAQSNRYRNTKIIVTSGSAYASDRRSALEAGADAFLMKPILWEDLQDTLSRLLEQEGPVANGEPADSSAPQSAIVRFWGVRGSIPTPGSKTVYYGGNTSCIEVRAQGQIIILDAGTGIRQLGVALDEEFKDRILEATILITHTHWDHIQGFPFFQPAYKSRNRIRIMGFEGARTGLESTLFAQMESPYFPITMHQMPGNIEIRELKDLKFNIGPIPVEARLLNHPGICTGYRLNTEAGSIAYLPDIELFQRLRAHLSNSPDQTGMEQQFARYQDAELVKFLSGCEILIIDSQYTAEEYKQHVGWGHSCVDDAVGLALEAEVKTLFLFHHDPERSDEEVTALVEHAQTLAKKANSSLNVQGAREGLEIILSPRASVKSA